MKKTLTSILTLAIAAASFPVMALAADNSDPVAKNGERLKYNTPYYLYDRSLSDKGGVTFESYASYDHAIFSHNRASNGTPIIFENKDKTGGFINSDDQVAIKSTKSNWPGWNYWQIHLTHTGFNGVWLTNSGYASHKIYGSSKDNSIGIGALMKGFPGLLEGPFFAEFKGTASGKAWVKSDLTLLSKPQFPPLDKRQTPLEVIEAI